MGIIVILYSCENKRDKLANTPILLEASTFIYAKQGAYHNPGREAGGKR